MKAVARQHGLDFVNVKDVQIPQAVVELVPESVARENCVLPLCRRRQRPEGADRRSQRRRNAGQAAVHPRPADFDRPGPAGGDSRGDQPLLRPDRRRKAWTPCCRSSPTRPIDFTRDRRPKTRRSDEEVIDENSAPIVRLVQLMITEAVQLRASDIHVEPFEDRVRIRYRIDGVLVRARQPPAAIARRHHLAHQDSGQDGHRRTPAPAGRPHQDHRRREGARPARQRAAHQPRPVGRDAYPGQGQHQGRRPPVGLCGRGLPASSGSSSAGPTASSWSPGRPAPARRPRSTPRSTS